MNYMKMGLAGLLCVTVFAVQTEASLVDGSALYSDLVYANQKNRQVLDQTYRQIERSIVSADDIRGSAWQGFEVRTGHGMVPLSQPIGADPGLPALVTEAIGEDPLGVPPAQVASAKIQSPLDNLEALEVQLQDELILTEATESRFWTRRKVVIAVVTVLTFAAIMIAIAGLASGSGSGAGSGFGGGPAYNSLPPDNPGPDGDPKIVPPPGGGCVGAECTGGGGGGGEGNGGDLPNIPSNPEPSTLLLMGLGLFLPYLRKRRA